MPCSLFVKDSIWTIWINVSGLKQVAIMASNSSPKSDLPADSGLRRASHQDMAEKRTRRRAELGDVAVPRNAGTRRTASKRALLKAIEDAGGTW